MPIEVASSADLPAIRRMLRLARHSFCTVADEDLAAVVARGFTFLLGQPGLATGLLVADPESRPSTLPVSAPTRVQIRALALRQSNWNNGDIGALVAAMRDRASGLLAGRGLVFHAFANEAWLGPALAAVGFTHVETVIYFRLDHLNQYVEAVAPRSPAHLRSATRGDLLTLAQLDANAFDPFWHMGESELAELHLRGRLTIAEVDGCAVGYSSLLNSTREEAHLARLAVLPARQGQGVGHVLLEDAIQWCRAHGVRALGLNTQLSNVRSQALYRAAGFRESGLALPVYTASSST